MSKENFQYWKELVGLEDTDFPQLIPLGEDEIEQAAIVGTRLMEIKNAVAANNLLDIQVQPGWGATTLYRYLKREFKKDSLTLLVGFDFEAQPLDGSLTEEQFVFQTKWRMASDICKMFRDKPMQPLYMYEVLGFEDDGASPWQGHLRRQMRRLESCENDPQAFYAAFPFFARRSIDVCVNYFLANFQIRSVFLYLFPRKVEEDPLFELVGMLKNIYDGKDIQPAAMRQLYICTPKLFRRLQDTYARPYRDILYERYSAAEMFKMLVATYHNDNAAFQSISDIFDEAFISDAYSTGKPMNKIMESVAKRIEDSLNGPTAQIPYKLVFSKVEEG